MYKNTTHKSEMRIDRDNEMAALGFLDVTAAAQLLGLSVPRTYAILLNPENDIEKRRLGKGSVYFSKTALEAYILSQKARPGWIILSEAMKRTKFSRSTLYKWAANGVVEMEGRGGRTFVRESSLDLIGPVVAACVYIYGLRDPRDGKIKYVGRTAYKKARLSLHISDGRTSDDDGSPKEKWISELLAEKLLPEMVVLEVSTPSASGDAETKWINQAKKEGKIFNINKVRKN